MTGEFVPYHSNVRVPITAILARPPYHVNAVFGPVPGLILAFSSIGHDPAQIPSPEFVGAATAGGRSALFIADHSRSWTNARGFADLLHEAVEIGRRQAAPGPVLTLGQSMGGFAALVAAEHLAPDAVLAFGPQSGIGAAAPPAETRWAGWTAALAGAPRLRAPLPPGPRITLMHGLIDDRAQALAFPRQAGTDHILFPDLGHSGLCPHLKTRGCLAGLVEAAVQGDRRRLLRIAASAGGRLRARLIPPDQEPR